MSRSGTAKGSRAGRAIVAGLIGVASTAVTLTAGLAVPASAPVAHAAASDASMQTFSVSPTSSSGSPKSPGQTFTFTLGMSCDSTLASTCSGAVVDIPLATFTDAWGATSQLTQTGGFTTTASVWSTAPAFTGTAPNVHVTGTLGNGAASGQTFSLSFSAIAPIGKFPAGTTTLTTTPSLNGTPQAGLTVTSYIAATAPSWVVQKTGPATLLLGANGTYTVKACPSPTTAAYPASFTLHDLLPAGATFVSASNGGTTPAHAIADGTTDEVVWTFDSSNRPWPTSGNCIAVTAVVKYVEDPAVGNVTNTNKINSATGTYDSTPLGTSPAQVTTGLRGPITSIGISKSVGTGGYYVKQNDPVRYDLSFSNTSEVGATALDTAVMTDDLSALTGITIASIDTGTWSGGVSAAVDTSTDGTTWTPLAGSPFNGTTQNVAAPVGMVKIRWTFTGSMPVGWATSGIHLNGSTADAGSPASVVNNCLTGTASRGASGFTATQRCTTNRIETPQPDPSISKQITSVVAADATAHTATTVVPGDTITYRIRVSNGGDATGTLDDPYVTDCAALTAYLRDPVVSLGTDWQLDGAYTDPTCSGQGGTPLKFDYVGAPIAAGATVTVATYTVYVTKFGDVEGVAPAADYPNTATLGKVTGSYEHGSYTSSATARVPAYVYLASQKTVLGALDEAAPQGVGTPDLSQVASRTTPGGRMMWYLTIENRGNVAAKDPVYVDIFPFVGDTGVKRTDQARGSQWAPYLVTAVTPPNASWTVQYSTSANPCRQEVGPSPSNPTNWPTGCDAPNWSTDTSLFKLVTYKSIRLTYTGNIPTGTAGLTFKWQMRAPSYDASYDTGGVSTTDPYEALDMCNADPPSITQDPTVTNPCPRAVNSFAWASEPDPNAVAPALNPGRLSSEPPRAGVQVAALPQGNGIGDRVWDDVDYDGIQDPGETGVSGVYVELYKWDATGSTWDLYGFTYTDASGNYRFDNDASNGALGLPDGQYKVRFYPSSVWTISPQDADQLGASDLDSPNNGNTDSDVPRIASGTGSSGAVNGVAYYETTSVTLSGNAEHDETWDMGLWQPAPTISITKVTKDTAWSDASAGDGVTVLQGRPVTWIYTVTNTGNTRLQSVVLTDNNGTAGSAADDFHPTSCTLLADGANADGVHSSDTAPMSLNRGASMVCTATGTAGSSNYSNIGSVTGVPKLDDGTTITHGSPPASVSASDPSSYQVAKYDLALMVTVGTPDFATGNVVYTITVKNQGTVASGAYSVTDTLPGTGMSYVSDTGSDVTSTAPTSATRLWSNLASLASGATKSWTMTMHIDDWTRRPWRDLAEISADSSASVQTAGVTTPTNDVDSTPDTDATNDMPNPKTYGPIGNPTSGNADNTAITQPGTGTDGEDDADIADLNPTPTYDLALSVVADATGIAANGDGSITYTITVKNQGNVDSGTYTVTDTVPTGLTVTTPVPGSGTVHAGSPVTITWDGTNLTPGSTATFTFAATITNANARNFRDFAEVSADSGQTLYSVNDVDSTPDANTGNDMPNPKTYGPVGNPTSGNADNTAISQAGTGTDGEDDADIADVSLSFATAYDLALAQTVDHSQVAYDDTITFTVTVQNQGVLRAGQFTITDHVPDGLTVTDLGGATDQHDGTITWTVDDLAPGATITRTFSATVADITKRPFRSVAEISADSASTYSSSGETVHDRDSTPDANVANDGTYGAVMAGAAIDNVDGVGTAAIDAAGVGADAPGSGGQDDADIADVDVPVTYDLALIKTGPAALDSSYEATFTITVANQGNVPSGAYTVTDVVPAGMTATDASDSGSLATPTTVVTWTGLPSLDPGESASVTVTMVVTDWTHRPFVNAAEITADAAATYSTQQTTVNDVDSTPGDVATSSVDVTTMASSGVAGDAGYDDEDTATVVPVVEYDLALVKTVDTATTTWDGQATFTILVENQGNVPSLDYTVTDLVPDGLSFVSASDGGTFDTDHVTWQLPSLAPGDSTSVELVLDVADVTQRPFLNRAEITADSASSYSAPGNAVHDLDSVPGDEETSTVDTTAIDQAGAGDDAGFDDEDVAALDVPVTYDLALVKAVDAPTTAWDGQSTFTITVANQGNVPSLGYTVTDIVPAGMSFVSASDGGTFDTDHVTWQLPSLDAGASASVQLVLAVADVTKRPFVNRAEITADSADSYSAADDTVHDADSVPGDDATSTVDTTAIDQAGAGDDAGFDDEDVATVDVHIAYDLALVKTVDAATTTWNGRPVFTIVVANQGNVPSGPFTVTDTIPAGLGFVSASGNGTLTSDSTMRWQLSSIQPGQTRTLQFVAEVTDLTKRPFLNRAEITADAAATYSAATQPVHDIDSVPGDAATSSVDTTSLDQAGVGDDAGFDDEDVAVVGVDVVYDLSLVKQLEPAANLAKGSIVRYDIRITNEGNVPSGPYSVEDLLPTGMSYVAASDGGASNGQVVVWVDLPSIAPGGTYVLTVDARLDDVTQPSYVNRAAITKDGSTAYSTPLTVVHDVDSEPAPIDPATPPPSVDSASLAPLPITQVTADNPTPAPGPLPGTGTDVVRVLRLAGIVALTGGGLVLLAARRRRQLRA